MTIKDDYHDLIGDDGNPCFQLVTGVLGVAVNIHGRAHVLDSMRFLLRNPNILAVCVELAERVAEDADGTLARRLLHPGPTGVAPDPDDGSHNEDGT